MDIPRTQSGSPCKLCKSKGEVCHIHKSYHGSNTYPVDNWESLIGTFGSTSSTPKDFMNFLDAPKPVLFEILLKMEPKTLKQLLVLREPTVYSIVQLDNFKRLYDIKHNISNFTLGKKVANKKGVRKIDRGINGLGKLTINGKNNITIAIEVDEYGFRCYITRKWDINVTIIILIKEQTEFRLISPNWGVSFIKNGEKWVEEQEANNPTLRDQTLEQLQTVLLLRGQPDWSITFNKNKNTYQMDKNTPREIFETIKTVLNKNDIPFNLIWK